MENLYELIIAVAPSFVMGGMIFIALRLYFDRSLNLFFKNEKDRREIRMKSRQHDRLFLKKIDACERYTIYLERINPANLLFRIRPETSGLKTYVHHLNQTISKELEHNQAQQFYLKNDTYLAIKKATLKTKAMIVETARNSDTVEEFRKDLLIEATQNADKLPSTIALKILKREFY